MVEGAALEMLCGETHLGFESLTLRQERRVIPSGIALLFYKELGIRKTSNQTKYTAAALVFPSKTPPVLPSSLLSSLFFPKNPTKHNFFGLLSFKNHFVNQFHLPSRSTLLLNVYHKHYNKYASIKQLRFVTASSKIFSSCLLINYNIEYKCYPKIQLSGDEKNEQSKSPSECGPPLRLAG